MSRSRRPGRRALSRLCGAAAVLLGGGGVLGMGCSQEPPVGAVAPPPLGAQADDDDACACAAGFYYNNQPIPLEETRCDAFVCGRDLISYQCRDGDDAPDNWVSYPENRCGDLACPAEGTFCGEDVVNGEPAALYLCPGTGQIPLDWRICPGGCEDGACTGEASGECPCAVPPIPGGDHIPLQCGMTLCFPTGAGNAGVRQVCTAEGWRSLGLACNQPQGDCPACRGVQDRSGRAVTTTACGEEVCGLGVGNRSRWVCGEEGWLDLNLPCDPGASTGEGALGRCPVEFRDNDGQWKGVEPGQTFCGDQVFGGRANKDLAVNSGELDIRIRGRADHLYACPGPGARPVPYRSCDAGNGLGACTRVRELPPVHRHEVTGARPGANEAKIRDWDRCEESCPPLSDIIHYFPIPGGNNGDDDCRHLFCGQHEVTGRVGTLYYCAYELDPSNRACPPLHPETTVPGRPVPYEECSSGCRFVGLANNSDVCDASVEQRPFGMPDPTPAPSITLECDPILDYQGRQVPARSLRLGSQICGPGGQVLACDERQLSRPDGWRATGISCGTSCGVCGPDPYGAQTPVCAYFASAEGLTCDDASFGERWDPCLNNGNVTFNEPAYCGYNVAGDAEGDPNMLYICKAYCTRSEGGKTVELPCAEVKSAGQGEPPWTREYRLDRSVYCPLGCQENEHENDECKRPGGGKRMAPLRDSRVIREFGVVASDYGGRHLGEDLVSNWSVTAGAEVHPVADGKLLWKGINDSQYLGVALVEHPPKGGTGQRYCSFYGHLDADGLGRDLVAGQAVTTDDVLGKVVRWNDIPRQHNLHFAAKWVECPTSSDDFYCDPGDPRDNSHLHYAVLSDEECDRFDGSRGTTYVLSTPYGYDQCETPVEAPVALTAMTAADACTVPMGGATTEGYISPTWFLEAPPQ
ncbi:MAG TPA: M23 family metallopeptidase [Sorangium sp.]|nr:M23 family metallopeptidase [Sorangium sp.]